MRRLMMLLTGSMIVILTGCTKYEIPKPECPEDLPTSVSFAGDVQPIFDQKCVSCHSGGQNPNLSLVGMLTPNSPVQASFMKH